MPSPVNVAASGTIERTSARVREVAGFFADPSMFGVVHHPQDATRGVVVCSPVYAEFMHNYGREIRTARMLARAGLAVVRVHYRGSGDSCGDPADLTVDSMVSDALEAVAHLRAVTGVEHVDALGARLGGHVAARVASKLGSERLVVWDPVVDMRRYFSEVFRARKMIDIVANAGGPGRRDVEEELAAAGAVDVVGYDVHRALFASAHAASFPTDGYGNVLLVQSSRSGKVKDSVQKFADSLEVGGRRVGVELVPPGYVGGTPLMQEGWWIHNIEEPPSPDDVVAAEQALLDVTGRFLL